MPTVVNDLIVEPQAMPPEKDTKSGGAGEGGGTAPAPPDIARQVKQIEQLCHERSMRLWAH
jgi:hypothetical protein